MQIVHFKHFPLTNGYSSQWKFCHWLNCLGSLPKTNVDACFLGQSEHLMSTISGTRFIYQQHFVIVCIKCTMVTGDTKAAMTKMFFSQVGVKQKICCDAAHQVRQCSGIGHSLVVVSTCVCLLSVAPVVYIIICHFLSLLLVLCWHLSSAAAAATEAASVTRQVVRRH